MITKSDCIRIICTFIGVVLLAFNMCLTNGCTRYRNINVLLIVCDTLRADHLSCYGYSRKTVNCDRLAENSILFKSAYSQSPCTTPSMWNILTSRYLSKIPASEEDFTIAEYFNSKSYRTGAFINKSSLKKANSNLHQGFDTYNVAKSNDGAAAYDHSVRTAKGLVNAAMKWIEKDKKRSFFVWLVFNDPHRPYLPIDRYKGCYTKSENFDRTSFRGGNPQKFLKMEISKEHKNFLINAYDEEIKYFDSQIGRLMKYLKESNLYDNSIIILTSDHGEELGDNGNLWSHCMTCNKEEIKIPLIIKMPEQREKREVYEAVQHIDIFPTLVHYFEGEKKVESMPLEGTSLMPFLTKQSENHCMERSAATFWWNERSIVIGNYKLHVIDNKNYFYNVDTMEPFTDSNISEKLIKQLNIIHTKYVLNKSNYYTKEIEKLRSLGYLQ